MELFFPWCPSDVALIFFDFLSLKDIERWELESSLENIFLPESYLLKKLKVDFQDVIYDCRKIKHWRKTFQHLYQLEHKKAKVLIISQDEVSILLSCDQNAADWIQKYPELEFFEPGDIVIDSEDSYVFVLETRCSRFFQFVSPRQSSLRSITDLPLKFFTNVNAWLRPFILPNDIVGVHKTVDSSGARWFLWIFLHQNVSYGIATQDKEVLRQIKYYIYYPCDDLLYKLSISSTILSQQHLTLDRICVRESDFVYLSRLI